MTKDLIKVKKAPLWLTILFFSILIGLFVQVVISEGGFAEKPFAKCVSPIGAPASFCPNPLINSSYCLKHLSADVCQIQTFTGTIGKEPGPLYKAFITKVFILSFIFILIIFFRRVKK